MPHIWGSSTPCTNAHVTAASTALPPRRITSRPISAACGCGQTIMATERKLVQFTHSISKWSEAPIYKSSSWRARRQFTCRFTKQVRGRSRGQSLVEAAITLPIVLLLALGVTDIGRSFYYREAVTNSVRQSLRIAVSSYQQTAANNVCGSTTGGPLAVTVNSAAPPAGGHNVTIANQAALESSKDGTPAGSAIAGATLTVTFHCLNGVAITNATGNANGPSDPGSDSVPATTTQPISGVTPLLWPLVASSIALRIRA